MWKPSEIIVHEKVVKDPMTRHFLKKCQDIPVKYVSSGRSTEIRKVSEVLRTSGPSMLNKILAGKKIVFIAPATSNVVDVFTMPDTRMMCPQFDRLKLASNGCFYQCDWCYLKLTYRAAFPFITVRAEYDKIKTHIGKRLSKSKEPVLFNSGEMADSLAMDHLTRAGRQFIPWFGRSRNGYLFMLTKSDNVNDILNLSHNNHTFITWSINNDTISRKFEIGAPSFERRLEAAYKVQKAGYPLRVRLDPIVPFEGWKEAYTGTVNRIFQKVSPERITIGTLRFEDGFYKMRETFFTSGRELPQYLEEMEPMFPPMIFPGRNRPKTGKYSFSEEKRIEIFTHIINEIRKYSDCQIALCKESANVWKNVQLDLSKCNCVCQFNYVNLQN